MPNNPVQIILNDQDFHQAPDPGQPPRNKDFFDGADQAFARHKQSLLASIDAIIAEIRQSPYGPAAYSPPLDPAFGAEFVRVNLEASLKQRQLEPAKDGSDRYTNQIAARYLPKSAQLAIPERALIDHGLKWWPSKQYESNFADNGASELWRLEVTSLVRADARFPAEGVPFAVLLTLEDPDGSKPIFPEFRQWLQTSRANAQDVRTAVRLRPRR